jgi:hypothetical protein
VHSSSLYYQEQAADFASFAGAQPADPDDPEDILEKSSSGFDHAHGEDDDFKNHLYTREKITLKTNAVLKAVSELKESKTPDFKPAGIDWFGETERAMLWKFILKDVEKCSVLGACRSALPLDTILGREEVEEAADLAVVENFQDAAKENERGVSYDSSLPWKKVIAVTTVVAISAYSIYKGEISSRIGNWIPQQVKNAYARLTMEYK